MDIVYLRLANGDELFANRISEEGSTILLDNVMIMETVHVEDETKYMFMTRYTQYCDKHSMAIERSQIIFLNEASDVVKRHYTISVQFAEEASDARLDNGIRQATSYLRKVLKTSDSSSPVDTSSTKH